MAIVPAKCTNCGAKLDVDNTKDALICPYCGSAFVVEKAINNYNVTNQFFAGVVNLFTDNPGGKSDFVIRAGMLDKYTGASANVVIPDGIEVIGPNVFADCPGLKSVTIPGSVTSIENNAFQGCTGLTSVTIPSSVTQIGNYAFSQCTGLTSITIPGSVTKIGLSAFSRCTGLTSVTLSEGIREIGGCAFEACTGLTSLTIPSSVIRMESWAFHRCTCLKQITFRCGFEKFGPYDPRNGWGFDFSAFSDCSNLSDITPQPSDEILERYFQHTPARLRRYEEKLRLKRQSEGICPHCGGEFTGLFRKVCSKCGRRKDY